VRHRQGDAFWPHAAWAQGRRLSHLDNQARQRAARQAIQKLAVGDRVMVTWRGQREAVITELRRSRLRAEFTLPDGTVTEVDPRADEVTPIEDKGAQT
jgi:hypothetical protein